MIHAWQEWRRDNVTVSTDPDRLDLGVIHGVLTQAYWSVGVTEQTIRRSIEHSMPFGVYLEGRQVGFARVITDQTTFAYLCDVFIIPEARSQGFARFMLECILAHPELRGLRTWTLFTRDAHGLYEQVGFERGKMLERLMVRRDSLSS